MFHVGAAGNMHTFRLILSAAASTCTVLEHAHRAHVRVHTPRWPVDVGGVCLGFFKLSTEKSRQIETNGVLWLWAFAKPKSGLHCASEAPGDVLPAALSLRTETVHYIALVGLPIYKQLPRSLLRVSSIEPKAVVQNLAVRSCSDWFLSFWLLYLLCYSDTQKYYTQEVGNGTRGKNTSDYFWCIFVTPTVLKQHAQLYLDRVI
jgi:hypothetical protein